MCSYFAWQLSVVMSPEEEKLRMLDISKVPKMVRSAFVVSSQGQEVCCKDTLLALTNAARGRHCLK